MTCKKINWYCGIEPNKLMFSEFIKGILYNQNDPNYEHEYPTIPDYLAENGIDFFYFNPNHVFCGDNWKGNIIGLRDSNDYNLLHLVNGPKSAYTVHPLNKETIALFSENPLYDNYFVSKK